MRTFFKSLRFRIFLIAAVCWLLPTLILGLYLGGSVFASFRAQTEAQLLMSASAAELRQRLELDRLITLAKSTTYDNTLENNQAKHAANQMNYNDFYRITRNYLDYKFIREQTLSFALFFLISDPDQFMTTTESRAETDEYRLNAHARALELGETLDTRCHFMEANGHTYLIRNLLNRKLQRFGMLVLGVNESRLLAPLLSADPIWAGRMDIALDDYQRLTGAVPLPERMPAQKLSEESDQLLLMNRFGTRDYTVTYRANIDKHQVYAQIERFNQLMVALVLLLLPIGALIMVFVARRITNPLNRLARASNRIENGELGVVVDIPSKDEVGQMARCYNGMSLQIKELIEKSFEEELALRDARIEALQSRINPHFLNNTLEMINWQARIEGSDTISRMIEAMSTLVNASLDRPNARVVPMSQELSVADAYFYFLDQRFGARLQVEREIDEGALNVPVPRLAIQTLLENAVEHGIAPAGGGRIRLKAHRDGGDLLIDVVNNGRRMTEADRVRIDNLLTSGDEGLTGKLQERLGIRNINRRAKLIYGDQAGLTLLIGEDGDTVARLRLPL